MLKNKVKTEFSFIPGYISTVLENTNEKSDLILCRLPMLFYVDIKADSQSVIYEKSFQDLLKALKRLNERGYGIFILNWNNIEEIGSINEKLNNNG